jgi:hypothetical protein
MWHHVLDSALYLADPVIQDPKPVAPTPALAKLGETILGWLKWGVLMGGVAGLLISAMMIVIGRRNRNAMAADGVSGAVWVIGGLALAASAAGLVGMFTL